MPFITKDGLVLWLPLSYVDMQGSPITSKDDNHFSCAVTGALWTPQGRSFDGIDDYINCGNSAVLNLTSAFTILVWMNPTAKANYGVLIAKLAAAESGSIQFILTFEASGDDRLSFYTNAWKRSTFTATYGSFGLYGITYDGTNTSFIKNTTIEAGQAQTAPASHVTYPLLIGASWSGNPRYGKGTFGEVLIYNRALTPTEIQNNYLATKRTYEVPYWDFFTWG